VKQNFRNYIIAELRKFINKYPDVCKGVHVYSGDYAATLTSLFGAIKRADQKMYIIIDDYDFFASTSLLSTPDGSRSKLSTALLPRCKSIPEESILNFFGEVLKSAPMGGPIDRMFVTGVVPFATPSLYILEDISDIPEFEASFGFTADEVKKAIEVVYPSVGDSAQSQLNSTYKEMKRYFDGYRFNQQQRESVYNPKMCVNYLHSLQSLGNPPKRPLDDAHFISERVVAKMFMDNYRDVDPSITTESYDSFRLIGETFDADRVFKVFHSMRLLNEYTFDDSLVSLAYYYGLLTHADPAVPERKEKLIMPNIVTVEMYLYVRLAIYTEANKSLFDVNDTITAAEAATASTVNTGETGNGSEQEQGSRDSFPSSSEACA
jgi:hypothetical protein